MTPLSYDESVRRLIEMALEEDLGAKKGGTDLTSAALLPKGTKGQAVFISRSPGVVAGLEVARAVYQAIDPNIMFDHFDGLEDLDGKMVVPGVPLAIVAGEAASLLKGERTALNFIQRLSGIATITRKFVDAVAGTKAQILDTRKTTPGWRSLERYAVRQGGGHNHRMGLFDAVLIKDNHLAFTPVLLREIIAKVRAAAPLAAFVEIEVESLNFLDAVLPQKPDIVLLDNMATEQMLEAVRRRDAVAPGVLLEASGGITLETVRAIAESGVDRISVGALTHSAPALDIGLDVKP